MLLLALIFYLTVTWFFSLRLLGFCLTVTGFYLTVIYVCSKTYAFVLLFHFLFFCLGLNPDYETVAVYHPSPGFTLSILAIKCVYRFYMILLGL